MSSEMEAIDKAKEAAEEARERKHLAPVSLTMAILAVLIATVSLLGHRSHTEEILLQNRATDQWAYYQAKNMRRNNLEALSDVLTALGNTKTERAEQVQKRFHEEIDKYRDQQKDIQNEARGLEAEVGRDHFSRRSSPASSICAAPSAQDEACTPSSRTGAPGLQFRRNNSRISSNSSVSIWVPRGRECARVMVEKSV